MFFTSLMNENLSSCLISGGSFSHITVALYEIVCFPVFVLTLVLWEFSFAACLVLLAMNIFGILQTCVKDIW